MSHFSTIKTQLREAEPLIKALNNLGFSINQDVTMKQKLPELFRMCRDNKTSNEAQKDNESDSQD